MQLLVDRLLGQNPLDHIGSIQAVDAVGADGPVLLAKHLIDICPADRPGGQEVALRGQVVRNGLNQAADVVPLHLLAVFVKVKMHIPAISPVPSTSRYRRLGSLRVLTSVAKCLARVPSKPRLSTRLMATMRPNRLSKSPKCSLKTL